MGDTTFSDIEVYVETEGSYGYYLNYTLGILVILLLGTLPFFAVGFLPIGITLLTYGLLELSAYLYRLPMYLIELFAGSVVRLTVFFALSRIVYWLKDPETYLETLIQ